MLSGLKKKGVCAMRYRQSVWTRLFWTTVRAGIRMADGARRTAPVILLVATLFGGTAVWLTTSAKAGHWVWKGWERMFGQSATVDTKQSPAAQSESSSASAYTITGIDDSNAGTGALEGTLVTAVNASGEMTGGWSDATGIMHGFVYANGTYTSFDVGSVLSPESGFLGTLGTGIDTAGDVIGIYSDNTNASHGFLLPAGSTSPISFDEPNLSNPVPSYRGTFPMAINDNGQIIGTYSTGTNSTTASSLYKGFLVTAANVEAGNIASQYFTEIDDTNAGTASSSYQKAGTVPIAINAAGTVTGYYVDSSGNRHGFIYSAATYTSFDGPAATTNTGKGGSFSGTIPMSIDAAGDAVGSYTDSAGVRHGFILPAGTTTATSFDAPGANTTSQSGTLGGTFPTHIDPTGSYIAGSYTDSSSLEHGFVYYLPLSGSGSFTTFTPSNQTTSTTLPIQGLVTSVNASGIVVGFYLDSNEVAHGFEYTPTATPPPTFSPTPGTYSSTQSVTISDTDSSAGIYYTTDGSTPTVNSTRYTDPIIVPSTETINAIALDSTSGGYIESAVTSATYTINVTAPTPAATPIFSVPSGTYASAQTVTISDATPGTTIYYTTNGTTPATSSTVYSGPITVSTSETIEAIAAASRYADSAVASAAYTISVPDNSVPVLSSLSPAFISSGGAAFTLTTTGTGFISGSTVYWGSTALTTTYVNPTQLTAQVPAGDIASAGTTAITVQTPSPGGGTSNTLVFEVDSGSSGSAPTFTTVTATVTPGSSGNYPVTLPSSASDVTVACLNLPAGASCSYSASSGAVTITTSSSTPAGTYQITVVFKETLPGAATGLIVLPILLLPLAYARRRWTAASRVWLLACAAIVLTTTVWVAGCGGGSSGSSGGGGGTTPQTHTVTSSGTVTLTLQ